MHLSTYRDEFSPMEGYQKVHCTYGVYNKQEQRGEDASIQSKHLSNSSVNLNRKAARGHVNP